MKRHRSLISLSRDHHHALVQGRDLSLAAAPDYSGNLAQAAARFASFWDSDLKGHFSQEEEILLPLLAKHTSPVSLHIRETRRQHAEIAQLVDDLNDRLARRMEIEPDLLNALGGGLRRHIRFEENELFPKLESSVPEEELLRMQEQLESERSRTVPGGCALSPERGATEG